MDDALLQSALRVTTEVRPGGRIEIIDSQLPVGMPVEVIVFVPQAPLPTRQSVLAVLAAAPGHLAFETAADVDAYLHHEREAWDA